MDIQRIMSIGQQKAMQYRKPIVVCFAVLLFYTLLGFFALPWFLQRYLTRTLPETFHHAVQVQNVSFNPFALKLQIDGFKISDTDNTPLLAFNTFRINYKALSIFQLRYGIEEIALEKPYIKLDANGKGGFTLLDMFASEKKQEPEKTKNSDEPMSIPSVWLGDLHIDQGVLDYKDAQRAGGFQQTLEIPNIALSDFYTQGQHGKNNLQLEIKDNDKGVISLGATLNSVQPLHIVGDFSIHQLNLSPVWQWLILPVNFHLQAPRLDVVANFDMQMADALDLKIHKASLSLKDLAVASKDNVAEPVIQLPLLAVKDVDVDLKQQSVSVGAFQADDGIIRVVLDKQGTANLQTLFTPVAVKEPQSQQSAQPQPSVSEPQQTSSPPPQQTATTTQTAASASAAQPAPPWNVVVHQVRFNNYTLHFRDEKPAEPFSLSLQPLAIAIDEWKPLAKDRFTIDITSELASEKTEKRGKLSVGTQLQLEPLVADTHIKLQQFPLSLIQPYVSDAVRANIKEGAAGAIMDVHFEAAEKPVVNIKGSANVTQLLVQEQGGSKQLLRWDLLDVSGLLFQLPNNVLNIEKITMKKPETGFVINPDGSTNIQKLLSDKSAKSHDKPVEKVAKSTNKPTNKSSKKEPDSAPLTMRIGAVQIDNANLGFADLSMKPNFKVAMSQLSGAIKGISSDPKTQASINLKGKVDRYAPVVIDGKLNPLAPKPNLDVHMGFNNLELTTFTPYSGTYAGFKIQKGQLSLDINYQLVDNKIQGKNKIVMNQLQLGDTVQSDKAVNLPLRLAISLLKDANGVIDLGFEVGGDLEDPQFSIGGILWKVLSNMVMKVVTSPFKAMSALVGGADTEGVDQITFAPGQSQLDQTSLTKLQTAANILKKRNELKVNVLGNDLPDEDRPALQDQRLINVLMQDNDAPAATYLSAQAAVDDGGAYRAVNRLYKKYNKESLGDIQDKLEESEKAQGKNSDSDTLKALAYEQAWKKLRDRFAVTDDELRQLALERAKQIKSALVEQNGIAPERVFVLEANADPAAASLTSQLKLDVN